MKYPTFIRRQLSSHMNFYEQALWRRRSGYALIWVLILLVIFSVLGTTFVFLSMSETKFASRSERQLQAAYVARSGAEIGYELLKTIPEEDAKDSIASFANYADSLYGSTPIPRITKFNESPYRYQLTFRSDSPDYMIIDSTATDARDNSITKTVSLYIEAKISGSTWLEPPNSWVRASNLWDNVVPVPGDNTTTALGNPVALLGSPTKSPQNSGDPSIFEASVLWFVGKSNSGGVSFIQQPNTNAITFRSEFLIFEGALELNDTKAIWLEMSNGDPSDCDWCYTGEVGFENLARLLDFIDEDSIESGGTPSDVYNQVSYEDDYKFENMSYGLLVLEDTLDNTNIGSADLPAGYYFFPSGVNIKNELNRLIKVDGNVLDKLKSAIADRLGSPRYRSSTRRIFYEG